MRSLLHLLKPPPPPPPSSIYLCSHLDWEALQARPLFTPRWAHQRELCVSLSVFAYECVCVSEGGDVGVQWRLV